MSNRRRQLVQPEGGRGGVGGGGGAWGGGYNTTNTYYRMYDNTRGGIHPTDFYICYALRAAVYLASIHYNRM